VGSQEKSACLQIHDEAKKFAYQTGIRVVVAYGGAPVHQQVSSYPLLYHVYCFLMSETEKIPSLCLLHFMIWENE
jgi:hypothetical protein